MRVVIAGGHGKIALLLAQRLTSGPDIEVAGLIRKPDQAADLDEVGSEPIELDLELASVAELTDAVRGADAVVFAAGAGAGSGAGRKETVDFAAALNLRDAATAAGVGRYVMVSSMGTDDPPSDDDVFSVYLRAKARADKAVMASDLAWTIVRPGALTDDEPTGHVTLDRHVDRGEITRADVAHVLAEVLTRPATSGHVFEVVGGDTDIHAAIDDLVAG